MRLSNCKSLVECVIRITFMSAYPRANSQGQREFTFMLADKFDGSHYPNRPWDAPFYAMDSFSFGKYMEILLSSPGLSEKLTESMRMAVFGTVVSPQRSHLYVSESSSRHGAATNVLALGAGGNTHALRLLAGFKSDARVMVNLLVANDSFRRFVNDSKTNSALTVDILLAFTVATVDRVLPSYKSYASSTSGMTTGNYTGGDNLSNADNSQDSRRAVTGEYSDSNFNALINEYSNSSGDKINSSKNNFTDNSSSSTNGYYGSHGPAESSGDSNDASALGYFNNDHPEAPLLKMSGTTGVQASDGRENNDKVGGAGESDVRVEENPEIINKSSSSGGGCSSRCLDSDSEVEHTEVELQSVVQSSCSDLAIQTAGGASPVKEFSYETDAHGTLTSSTSLMIEGGHSLIGAVGKSCSFSSSTSRAAADTIHHSVNSSMSSNTGGRCGENTIGRIIVNESGAYEDKLNNSGSDDRYSGGESSDYSSINRNQQNVIVAAARDSAKDVNTKEVISMHSFAKQESWTDVDVRTTDAPIGDSAGKSLIESNLGEAANSPQPMQHELSDSSKDVEINRKLDANTRRSLMDVLVGLHTLAAGDFGAGCLQIRKKGVFRLIEFLKSVSAEEIRSSKWTADILRSVALAAETGQRIPSSSSVEDGTQHQAKNYSAEKSGKRPYELVLSCLHCEELLYGSEKFHKCTGCGVAGYCSASCLQTDWNSTHKHFCAGLSANCPI